MKDLMNFIDCSPTAFHAVEGIKGVLDLAGFEQLFEVDVWQLALNKKYYVTRNDSTLLAFTTPSTFDSIQICATHLDSPCFKLKDQVVSCNKNVLQLDVERYGGMILNSWFDRPLSIAGRMILEDRHASVLFDVDKASLMIPNVAIHLNREGTKDINVQKEMMPVIGLGESFDLLDYLKENTGVEGEVLALEAFLYNRQKALIWGKEDALFSAPRIDNLECSYAMLKSIVASENNTSLNIAAFYDNEEVGSATKQGADSTILEDVITRVCESFALSKQAYLRLIASGFMISSDNAHAYHPNYPELYSKNSAPSINGGIVIKHNANQRYTTDALSDAIFSSLCKKSGVNVQHFYNHSNVAGGGTLGNIASSHVSMRCVDIGLPQWAMHSSFETAGVHDFKDLVQVLSYFYNHTISTTPSGTNIL